MQNKDILEQKVRKYIKMKKFFIFSDALMVTSSSKDSLLRILEQLEKEGLIKLDKNEKSIMNRSYTVLSRREKKILSLTNKVKPFDRELIKSINKLCNVLDIESSEAHYIEVLNESKLSKGVFANTMKCLVSINILQEKEQDELVSKHNKVYKINKNLFESLLTFLKQKKYQELQLILDGKKPLKYVVLPNDLPQILETITQNEVLKRDELSSLAEVTRKRLSDWWRIIQKLGIVIDSYKESQKERVTYIFSAKRARLVLKQLNNGAYEKDKELKHLWMQ